MHLWVDAIHGDDAAAADTAGLNPGPGIPSPTCNHPRTYQVPLDVNDTTQGKLLLHAPYPFKTIGGAVGYINRLAFDGAVQNGPLPFTSADGEIWKYAVIHLLPGLYSAGSNPESYQPTGNPPVAYSKDNGRRPTASHSRFACRRAYRSRAPVR